MKNVQFVSVDDLKPSAIWTVASNLGLSESDLASRLMRVAKDLDSDSSNLLDLVKREGLFSAADGDTTGVSHLLPVLFGDGWIKGRFCKKLQAMHQEWGELYGSSVSYAPLFDTWRALGCSGKLWDYGGEKRMSVPAEALPDFQAILLDISAAKRLESAIFLAIAGDLI